MHALIDTDIFLYEMGRAVDEEGSPLAWGLVQSRLEDRINSILEATESDSWQGYITGQGNFREELATIKPYKGNRKRSERPYWYEAVKHFLVQERNVTIVHGMEADDQIAMDQGEDTIICSLDKDLKQVPGWHYSWEAYNKKEWGPVQISEVEALQSLYRQLLTGDSTDNILGLYGVGHSAACVKRIGTYTTELEMFREVKVQYELRFGNHWPFFLQENGRLLYLLRHDKDNWEDRQWKLTKELAEGDSRLLKTAPTTGTDDSILEQISL